MSLRGGGEGEVDGGRERDKSMKENECLILGKRKQAFKRDEMITEKWEKADKESKGDLVER